MSTDPGLFETLVGLVEGADGLAGRVGEALDLAELVRAQALPPANPYAFVVPLGLRPLSQGDAGAGAFTQMVEEHFGVMLAVRSAGDATGARVRHSLTALIWAVRDAVVGADPGDAVPGVFRLVREDLVSMRAGLALYQLNFAVQLQLRRT